MLLKIFLAALAIRWTYVLVLYAAMGNEGILGGDSRGYLIWTESYAAALRAGTVSGWQWLAIDLILMPLAPWLWTASVLLFGAQGVIAFVLLQGVIDSATCLLICGTAKSFDARFAAPAGVAAALNPTQIVMSGMLYTDTLFLFFVALTLFACMRWLRGPSWSSTVLLGLGLGGAALSRILIVPWGCLLLVFLLLVELVRGRLSWLVARQTALVGIMLGLCVAPILTRNVTQYGSWALTPQTGAYYALWIAPLVRQAKDGTPWADGAAEMQQRLTREAGPPGGNPFEASRRYGEIGRQALAELGPAAVAKAWLYGAAINLASPALILSPPVLQLPRTGFYGTPGASMADKIANFLFHSDNALYAWLLLIGIAGVALVRLVQCVGLLVIVRDIRQWPAVLLMASWVGFILLVNGPIASPKYRLPIEPPLMVLAGAGFVALRDWRSRKAARSA